MEETQEQAQNVAVEDNSVSAPPADEPTTSESTETEGQAEQAQIEEPAAEDTGDSERKPTRAERRIRQLANQVKQYEQSNQSFVGPGQSPQFPQYEPGQEIAPEQLSADVVQTAQAIANLTVEQRLAQERAINNVERDAEVLPKQYPELDPESSEYIPELEAAVEQEFKEKAYRVTGYDLNGQPIFALDPSVRLADIAKRYTETARAAAKKSSAEMKNAVARTADEAAVKPAGQPKTDKPVEEMSIAEIEAKFGFGPR